MTPIFIIIGLVLNGILAHIIGNVATDRKIGYNTAFLVSFLLSPLIGLLLVIASVPLTEAERDRLSYGSSERPSYTDWLKRNPNGTIREFLDKYPQ